MAEQDRAAARLPERLTLGDDFEQVDLEQWQAEAERSLRGRSVRSLESTLLEGIRRRPLYAGDAGHARAQAPGVPPFARGTSAPASTPKGWSVCAQIAGADASTWAAQARTARSQGADSFLLQVDQAAELEPLLQAVAGAALHLAPGSPPAHAAALLAAAHHGDTPVGRAGSLGCDPLAALAADGEVAGGIEEALAQLADLVAWAAANSPGMRAVSLSSMPYHAAGATAVQELAFTLATGVEYLRAATGAGLAPDTVLGSMTAAVSVGRDFFVEIAKLRALRQLWCQVALACGGSPEAAALPILAITSERTQTARDPWVNLLRGTAQVAAAAMGGAETIVCRPYDAPLGRPDSLARRMALNTQSILREESHIHRLADPAGGSWYVEEMTTELARAAWTLFQSLEARGGMRACLLSGYVATLLGEAFEKRRRAVATRSQPITGVSSFPHVTEQLPQRDPDPPRATGDTVVAGLPAVQQAVAALVSAVAAGTGDGCVTAAAVAAFSAGATMGEVGSALAGDRPPDRIAALPVRRDAEPFEALREAGDRHLAATGARPRVFLASMGTVAQHKARTTFTQNLVEAGGLEAVTGEGFDTVAAACDAFRTSGARVAAICSSDERYQDEAAPLAEALKAAGAESVLVAGKPGEHEQHWRGAGVDHFVYTGCDVLHTLVRLHVAAGVDHD